MREYECNNAIYIDINDIRQEFKSTYCKGIRSNTQLLERKQITDFVYGRVVDNQLIITEKLSKKMGSTFISKSAIIELFETKEDPIPLAPPLLEDKDLVFFKDDQGREYNVPMRGERSKDGIYFQVKAVMYLFEMMNLSSNIQLMHTQYQEGVHYVFFNTTSSYKISNSQVKEMYLTYAGLLKVIHTSRSGIGHTFKSWIDEIVFSSIWGTQEQKIETFQKVLNVDAGHLKAIMSKSPTAISCLYLIDVGINENNKKVFKYGFSNDIQRRFKEHVKHYGDQATLETFILIPALSLSQAEAEFKNSVSRYKHTKDSEQELIAVCEEAYMNVKNIFKTISDKYCGNMGAQITLFENEIKDLKHSYELKMQEKDMQIMKLSMTVEVRDKEIEVKEKDNEILRLKLQLLEYNYAKIDKEIS